MRLFCTAWALAAGSLLACAGTATATIITPTVTTDDLGKHGTCTLREAIDAANTNARVDRCAAGRGVDVIRLGAHTYTVRGHLGITAPVTIVGAGSGPTTIDAGGTDRVLVIGAGAPTTLQDLTLTGGHPAGGPLTAPGGNGGAIQASSPLTLTSVYVNSSSAGDGSDGGGVWSKAPLTVTGGSFTNDHAGNGSAGLAGGNGGAIAVAGGAQLTIAGSRFSNDSAGNGGAGAGGGTGGAGGAIAAAGPAKITGVSTGQTSAGAGGAGGTGGTGGSGGAISGGPALLEITGSTLTSASAGAGGAGGGTGGSGGAVSSAGTLTIDHTTMSFDRAGDGGTGGGAGGTGGAVGGADVIVTNSTVSGSAAGAGGSGGTGFTSAAGGAGGGGGGVHARGTISLRTSTLDHDAAGTGGAGAAASSGHAGGAGGNGGAGGGVLADGGGTIDDVTMFADRAGNGGAGGIGSGAQPGGAGGAGGDGGSLRGPSPALALLHMTVVGGVQGAGGAGVPSAAAGTTGGIAGAGTVAASVLSGNAGPQCSGTLNGGGNVNAPDPSCGGIVADPRLGPLENNGGPAPTFLPAPGSPVIDIVPPGSAACTTNDPDERGASRPQGPTCDSGAVEAANPALSAVPSPVSFSSVPSGHRATMTITIHASFDPVTPAASLAGPDARTFSIGANRCARRTLASLGACTLLVTFRSSGARGTRHATLHVAHDRAGPPLDVPLGATVGVSVPVISSLSLSNPTFAATLRVTTAAASRRTIPKGTIIAFRLSEPATVKLSVEQRAPGRLRGKRCVAPTAGLASAKRCTRTIVRGTFSRRRVAGINHVVFSGRFRRGALAPGRYALVLAPTAFGRVRGRSRSIGFTIVRG
jgi:CSLREA domain-containing protein